MSEAQTVRPASLFERVKAIECRIEELDATPPDAFQGPIGDLVDTIVGRVVEAVRAELRSQERRPATPRANYSVEEVAKLLGKSAYTVREWCRHGRLHAIKRQEKRGGAELWSIPAEEFARYQDEGLLPIVHPAHLVEHPGGRLRA